MFRLFAVGVSGFSSQRSPKFQVQEHGKYGCNSGLQKDAGKKDERRRGKVCASQIEEMGGEILLRFTIYSLVRQCRIRVWHLYAISSGGFKGGAGGGSGLPYLPHSAFSQ